MILISIPLDPIPKGRPRFTRSGITYTPARTRAFENQIKMWTRRACKTPLEGPLSVQISLFFKRPKKPSNRYPRGDIDNFCKGILDSLNKIAYLDDSQITELKAWKFYADESSILIKIEENEDE